MLDPQVLETLRSVVAPALGGAVLLLLLWRPWRRDQTTGERMAPHAWVVGVALAATFVASWLIAQGFHGLWPKDTSRRIIWAPVLGLAIGGAASIAPGAKRWPVGLIAALVGSLALTWALTAHRRQPGQWEGAEVAIWTGAWTVALGAGWFGLVLACSRRPGALLPLTLSLAATALALIVTRAGVASLGQMGGALSAWLGFAFLLAVWNRSFSLAGAGAHALGASLAAIIVLGYTTSPDPRPTVGLGMATLLPMAVVPAALLMRTRSDDRTARPLTVLTLDLLTLVAVAGIAIWFAKPPAGNPDEPSLDELYGRSPVAALEVVT